MTPEQYERTIKIIEEVAEGDGYTVHLTLDSGVRFDNVALYALHGKDLVRGHIPMFGKDVGRCVIFEVGAISVIELAR